MYFFQHKMRKSVFHSGIHIPVGLNNFRHDFSSFKGINFGAVSSKLQQMFFRQDKILSAVGNQSCQIRSYQGPRMRVRGYQRAYTADCIDFSRTVLKHDTEAVGSLQKGEKTPYSLCGVSLIKGVKNPSSHLTVCLRLKLLFKTKLTNQLMIVFNDAIVNKSNPAGLMGMGIVL